MAKTKEEKLKETVVEILQTEQALVEAENALQAMPEFKAFINQQREAQEKINLFWKNIEEGMLKNDIKSIKDTWGTLTIAERLNWSTTDELAPKFYKKVVDTTKLSDTYRLTNVAPKGATPSYTKYLTKRLKKA